MIRKFCLACRWGGLALGGLSLFLSGALAQRPSSLTFPEHLMLRFLVFGVFLLFLSLLRLAVWFFPRRSGVLAFLTPFWFPAGFLLYRWSGDPTDIALTGVIQVFWGVRVPCRFA